MPELVSQNLICQSAEVAAYVDGELVGGALEAFEEHRVVKRLLSELESMPKTDERWGAKLKVLQENVEHHVEEEEGEMFKSARKVLSQEQIEELGARMEAAKREEQKAASAS